MDGCTRYPKWHWWAILLVIALLAVVVILVAVVLRNVRTDYSPGTSTSGSSSTPVNVTGVDESNGSTKATQTQTFSLDSVQTRHESRSSGFTTVLVPVTRTHRVVTTPRDASTTLFVPAKSHTIGINPIPTNLVLITTQTTSPQTRAMSVRNLVGRRSYNTTLSSYWMHEVMDSQSSAGTAMLPTGFYPR